MTDYASFKRGAVTFPLATGQATSALRRADPFLFYALEFFGAVIEQHIEDALLEVAPSFVTAAVAYKVPIDPVPFLTMQHFRYPLLAVYRRRSVTNERTVQWRHGTCTFEALYLFPPLTPGDAEQVVPFLNAVAIALDERASHGSDPSYTPTGGSVGQSPWELANLEKCEVTGAEWGLFAGHTDQVFYGVKLTGTVKERDDFVSSDFETFAGANVDVDHVESDGSSIESLVEANTQQAPTLASISPTSGIYTGNVLVTATGTLFKAPMVVRVGGLDATSVVVTNATTLTFRTPALPAHAIGTAVDVEVENDFGSATLTDAYTLTS